MDGEVVKVDLVGLDQMSPDVHLIHLLFSEYGNFNWSDLLNLLKSQSGKIVSSDTYTILKDRTELLIYQKTENNHEAQEYVIESWPITIEKPLYLDFQLVADVDFSKSNAVHIDVNKLSAPLVLRKKREGDWFIPLGMKGRKKIAKYYKEQKMNLLEKDNQWLLCSGDEIIWVIGRRLDQRYAVTEQTERILRCHLKE